MQDLIFTLLFWVAGGYGLRKAGVVRPEAAADLTQLVLWLTLPPLIFTSLHGATLSGVDLVLPVVAWVASAAAMAGGWAIARTLALPPHRAGALVLALAFGNTTFLGYPLIAGLYPEPAPHLTLAILYDQLGATFAVNTLGVVFAGTLGGEAFDPRRVAVRLLRFPPLWALALGLGLRGVPLPSGLVGFLHGLGTLTVPLVLLSMGVSLRFGLWRQAGSLVAVAALAKLVAMPAGVWLAVTALGLPRAHVQAAVLEAAMPTMFYSLTLALGFGLEVPLVVNAIVLSTLLSAVTLPLWHMVVR